MAGRQFSKPGIVDPATENYTDYKTAQFSGENEAAHDKADDEFRDLYTQQRATKKSDLHENDGKNIARGEGTFGMPNARSYDQTLRLARRADAYNNMPLAHGFVTDENGNAVDMGTGFEKPKIETAETRAMAQSMDLDANQKRLAQALQDAVNHKDLNAFIQVYQQMYGNAASQRDAEIAFRNMARGIELQKLFGRHDIKFSNEFMRGFNDETVAVLLKLGASDPQHALMLGQVLNGTATPSVYDRLRQEAQLELYSTYLARNPGMSKMDAWNQSENDLYKLDLKQQGRTEAITKRSNSLGNNWSNYKYAKDAWRQ